MRQVFLTSAAIMLLCSTSQAFACAGDGLGRAGWKLDHKDFSSRDNLPFLSPGNDSRVNAQFLMMDARPWPVDARKDEAKLDIYPDYFVLFARDVFNDAFARNSCDYARRLVKDATSTPSDFLEEGTRCVSVQSGEDGFVQAAQADRALSDAARAALIRSRKEMTAACRGNDAAPGAPNLAANLYVAGADASAAAREFATYLAGAKSFYDGGFDAALAAFRGLAKAQNEWLRESARYMVARTLLNKASVGAFAELDGAPEPKVADRDSLKAAEAEFKSYLADDPHGRYAASARGLLRRVYWLAGDRLQAATEYAWQLSHARDPNANLRSSDLAAEIDSKLGLDSQDVHDANLLAIDDLTMMRQTDESQKKFSAADLDAQARDFAGHEALFNFLEAARAYYVDGDHAKALTLLGDSTPGPLSPPNLGFSREVLRGQALMADGRNAAAIDHWTRLLPRATLPWQKEAVELGLALSWERSGEVNKVFLKDTQLSSARIRAMLLRYIAGPILLRMAVADPASAEERKLARFVLLFKEATHGQYAGFLRDYSAEGLAKDDADTARPGQYPNYQSSVFLWGGGADKGYVCPDLKSIVGELAANPQDPHAMLCFGDFIRTNSLDGFEASRPKPDELGGGKSIFPGEPYARGEVYKKLIGAPATPARERAYALYRAINCYAPANNNTCGGKDVEKAQRKAWYDQLKAQYGATTWAKSLRYYW
ncbi:MAG: hypothetical protein AB7F41_05145 [Methylocystis sp.]|uniref:hypothetical protein n=1 Tax=Methylocystis sp. TaxID=1911079 RepID=UPI003D13092F